MLKQISMESNTIGIPTIVIILVLMYTDIYNLMLTMRQC